MLFHEDNCVRVIATLSFFTAYFSAFPPILPVASFDPAGVSSFDPTDEPRFFGQCRSGPGYPRPKIALFKGTGALRFLLFCSY